MYRTCLFCLGPLGSNAVIEALPVGRTVAFDADRGRLWVVCPECRRWNLTPIEERWEAIEAAEERFQSAGRRVVTGNIGFSILSEGTRLIRVGKAMPGEYASCRYGSRMSGTGSGRYRRFTRWLGSLVTGSILAPGVFDRFSVIHRDESGGQSLIIRRSDLDGAEFARDAAGRLSVQWSRGGVAASETSARVANALLERMLINVNREAAPDRMVASAVQFLDRHGTGRQLFESLGEGQARTGAGRLRLRYEGEGQWRGEWAPVGVAGFQPIPRYRTVALEMAMHEDTERRALEGELSELRRRWKEAEEIARIADSLT